MLAYKESLAYLKQLLIFGEIMFLSARLISQVLFTSPTAFALVSLFLASIIYCRNICALESQVKSFQFRST